MSALASKRSAPPLAAAPVVEKPDPVGLLLDGIDPDSLSPREALDALYRLKAARTEG